MANLPEFSRFPAIKPHTVSLNKIGKPMRSLIKAEPVEGGNEIWFITLSDLLLLLMIFFVLFLAITLKQQSNKGTLEKHPSSTAADLSVPAEKEINRQITVESAAADQTALLAADLEKLVLDKSNRSGIMINEHKQHVILIFPEQIIFDSGQAELKPSAGPLLTQVAAFIQDHPSLSVEIQGHTDDRPISSIRYPSNWELSADRATRVAKHLIGLGINPVKISTRGFGEYHPLYPNDSDTDRLKNRRVEMQFSYLPT